MKTAAGLASVTVCAFAAASAFAADTLVVGSKRFTESYILGEIISRTAGEHAPVQYRPGLGNTGIVFAALEAGSIDIYPDYSGTLAREVLKLEHHASLDELNRRLAAKGVGV
ncbi:MAG: glycine betaine ABC transporter substrate-binding protein, partial [Burkholderiales bacterium]